MKKISISISGHKTSLSLENEFIDALHMLAAVQKKSVAELIREIDEQRATNNGQRINLSSAVRLHILKQLMPK